MGFAVRWLLLLAASTGIVSGMTRAQLKKTMSIMKNQCMPKTGVTNGKTNVKWNYCVFSNTFSTNKSGHTIDDKVGQIEQGVFIEDHNVMCYVSCVYKTIQVVKNDKLDKDLVFKQVDALYPVDIRTPVKAAITKCIGVQENYSDPCEGIFYSTKCLFETDPANFIFP